MTKLGGPVGTTKPTIVRVSGVSNLGSFYRSQLVITKSVEGVASGAGSAILGQTAALEAS